MIEGMAVMMDQAEDVVTTVENAGAACTDLMVAGQAVPFSIVCFLESRSESTFD